MQRCTEYIGVCRLVEDNTGRLGFFSKEWTSQRDNGCHDKRTETAGCDEASDTLHRQEA